MGNTAKEYAKLSIQQPYNTTTATLEKDHKMYSPTAKAHIESSKNTAVVEKVKLTYKPLKGQKLKKLPFRNACLTLLNFPNCIECTEAAAILMLLLLLCQAAHLLAGVVPTLPILLLNSTPQTAISVLTPLLRAVQGPELWKGADWKLHRPHIIRPKLSLMETRPSQSLVDYIGGYFRNEIGKKQKFCFPIICSSVALLPDLPSAISQKIIQLSPLSLPILFEKKLKIDYRSVLELPPNSFNSYDPNDLNNLSVDADNCYPAIILFFGWLCEKQKRIKRWRENIDHFCPVTRKGRFATPQSDERTEWLCAALALFQQFLFFASERNDWLTQEEAKEFMLRYWRLALPESAPQPDGGQFDSVSLSYEAPELFYRFLTDYYLPTYQNQVLNATKGFEGTVGLIRNLEGIDLFITPRKVFLKSYAKWLEEHHASCFALSTPTDGAVVQRKLMEAGVPLRGEKNNPSTWRHAFYKKRKDKVDCLALPIPQLPEQVQATFESLFGLLSDTFVHPTLAEVVPNSPEGAEVL